MDQSKDKYWVMGGLYTDTDFKTLVEGTELEEYGPFDSYQEAKDKWRAKSWQSVDQCSCRYRILVEIELELSLEEYELIKRAAKELRMTENDFVIYVLERHMKEYKENHPFTREDFIEISD